MIASQRADLVLGVAAVSHFLDTERIAKRLGEDPAGVAEVLLPEIESEIDDAGAPRWLLRASRRQDVLSRANESLVNHWIAATDEPADDVETVLRSWLRGGLDLDRTARDSRDTLRQVANWLRGCGWVKPTPQVAETVIDRAALRGRLEESAGPGFVDREPERAELTRQLSAGGVAVLEASGGMGKSALLSRWLLDQQLARPELVSIVIDFDDPTMTAVNLDYLYYEIARQAALQVPAVEPMRAEIQISLAEARNTGGEHVRGLERNYTDSRGVSLLISMFSTMQPRPTIVVLDTFERALRAPRVLVEQMITTLRQAMQWHPGQALLVAGRGPIEVTALADVKPMKLQPLPREEGRALLRSRDVPAELCGRILDLVPASPLTLRLAARAVANLGLDLLDDDLRRALELARIDGYLHRRVLGHLPSPRLRSVARVAVLVRMLTPERLLEIVGPLVEPPIVDLDEARRLLHDLASVSDLASTAGGPNRLELRPEVFEELTELVQSEDPGLAARLHARAVEVLAPSSQPEDQDAREYHAHQLQRLSGQETGAQPSLTVRELRTQVPELLRAGSYGPALELVLSSPAAQRDPRLLLLGARAAKGLVDSSHAEQLARAAMAIADAALPRAQAALYLAWVAELAGDDQAARRQRDLARAEYHRIASSNATVVERAEVITGVAMDAPEWAAEELRRLFARPGARDALATADLDVIRHVASLVRTPEMLAFAANVKAFEYSLDVDFSRLANVVEQEPELGTLDVESLVRAQRSRALGPAVTSLALHGSMAVRDALADLLDQMRAPEIQWDFAIDPGQRAQKIASLADAIYEGTPDVKQLFDGIQSETFRFGKLPTKEQVHSSILQVDRMRLGKQFVRSLEDHGLDDEAKLAADLFVSLPFKKGLP